MEALRSCCTFLDDFKKNNEFGLIYLPKFREYGFEYLDGGTSFQQILFCPWCGARLPVSLRDEWFNRLEALGIDTLMCTDIPIKFQTSEWWEINEKK